MVNKIVKNTSFWIFGLVLVVCSVIFFVGHANSGYSDVMRRANAKNSNFGNSKVYDIAMLGAHDSLSDKITKDSKVDYASDVPDLGVLMELGLVRSIIANYCRTQSQSLEGQLKGGARYIDVRITYKDGVFYGTHGLIGGRLDGYLKELINFLLDNPGEFVVFHIAQYNKNEGNTEDQLAEYMNTVTVTRNGKKYSIYDFINYNTSKDFSKVTYNDVTKNGTRGGVVIISNFRKSVSNPSFKRFFYYKQYHSTWYNEADPKVLLSKVDGVLRQYKNETGFKCNGFQTTQNGKSIALNLWGSLIKNARSENIDVVNHSHFDYWLQIMPIACFDDITSTKGDFNSKINQKILDYNLNLNKTIKNLKYKKITSSSQLKDGMKIMIKEADGTNGYYGNNYKPGNIGTYVGGEFIMQDKNMWQLEKSGKGWKIKRPDGNWLDRSVLGYLVTTKKRSSAVVFEFDFFGSGEVKIHYDKYYMYLDSKKNLDLSKSHSSFFEVYA